MEFVHEVVDAFPFTEPAHTVRRRESLLLAAPVAGFLSTWRDPSPIELVHFDSTYVPQEFSPPKGVYESEYVRVERQTMNNRQSFYHRNMDCDEMSYQVWGGRTLMTELGTVELAEGDFSQIPVGVAHDNWGREEVHLLFYIPAGVEPQLAPAKSSELLIPPYEGWEPTEQNEVFGEGLGNPDGVMGAFPIDETLLLQEAQNQPRRIAVLRPDDGDETSWLYKSDHVWIGRTRLDESDGSTYRRHRNCDEVQYQVTGRRTVVSQLGTLHLEPGDFVRIPMGVAFTSIATERSEHIVLVSGPPLPQVSPPSGKGQTVGVDELDELRPQALTS